MGDLRCPYDTAIGVIDRRNTEQHIDKFAILAAPLGLVGFDLLASADLRKDRRLLFAAIVRNEHHDRVADSLFG